MKFNSEKIDVQNVSVRFDVDGTELMALEDFSLTVGDGEFVVVLGPSGCGKSTALNLVAGFQEPTSGEVFVNNVSMGRPGPDRGVVFQDANLFPWLSVWKNITFGPHLRRAARSEYVDRAKDIIELVGLSGFENHLPGQLSGGMQQRASLARVLVNEPDVLLMDEPFGALDAQTRITMQELLLRVWEQHRRTVLFITHDIDEALLLADRIYIMTARPGKLKEILPVELARPRDYKVTTSDEFQEMKKKALSLLRVEAA